MKKFTLTDAAQRPLRWFSILVSSAAWACSAAGDSPRYSVIPLGTPGTESAWSENFMFPRHINNRGDVIGERGRGVALYRDGTIYDLGYPREPLENGWISAISDRGEMLGVAFAESAVSLVLRPSNPPLPFAEARMLPVPGLVGWDFNNHGSIIGYIYDWQQDTSTPVAYHDGRITELPRLVPGGYAGAHAINNRGQIVGDAEFHDGLARPYGTRGIRAVIWSGGRIQNLGVLPGFHDSYAIDINDHGEAVGSCINWEGYAAFIYRRGVMQPLPSPPGARHTFAHHINDSGDVLIAVTPWHYDTPLPYDPETYWLYSNGALHDLTPIVAQTTGWSLRYLYLVDMNDRGQIIGEASYDDGHGGAIVQGILLVPR